MCWRTVCVYSNQTAGSAICWKLFAIATNVPRPTNIYRSNKLNILLFSGKTDRVRNWFEKDSEYSVHLVILLFYKSNELTNILLLINTRNLVQRNF